MAERRMFAKNIIDSDMFLEMPSTTQLLYFHLAMRADDDGFINNPKRIMRDVRCSDNDMQMLIAKQYIIAFDSGIIVIRHWRIHNYLRKDRYRGTQCIDEMAQLSLDKNEAYQRIDGVGIPSGNQLATNGIPDGNQLATNDIPMVDPGKVRIGKDRLGKVRIKEKPSALIDSYTDNQDLRDALNDFVAMRKKIKAPMTDRAVTLMLSKLDALSSDDRGKMAIVNQSIMNSWKGIFPLNDERRYKQPPQTTGSRAMDEAAAAIAMLEEQEQSNEQ